MFESDIWFMPKWKRRLLGVEYEHFSSHVNTLTIKLDRLPNPTKEEQEIGRIEVEATRYTATHWPGKRILRSLFKDVRKGPKSLIKGGTCLEIFPLLPLP